MHSNGFFYTITNGIASCSKNNGDCTRLFLPWSTIYFAPLPSYITPLLATFPLIAFSLYLHYRRSPARALTLRSLEKSALQKAVGIIVAIAGLFLSLVVLSVGVQYGLFLALAASQPTFFIMFLGCSLVLGGGTKRAILWSLLFAVSTMLPATVLLPLTYQLVSYALAATVFILGFLWYRRKFLSQHKAEKRDERTGLDD